MKNELKFIGLLVLMWVLAVSNSADATLIVNITEDNLGDYAYEVGDGTIEIVSITNAPGTVTGLSLELIWPTNSDDAGIQITDLGDPTISSIDGWDYWVKAPEYFNPHLTMFLDTTGNDSWDTEVKVGTYNVGYGDEWFNIDSSGTISLWIDPSYDGHSQNWTWSEFQTEFGDATVEKIRISHYGYYVGDSGVTTYLDDFTFGDTSYQVVPEPATIALFGLGSLFLLRRRK